MNAAEFLVHAFVWMLILAGLVMGIGYVYELWSEFLKDWKDAAESRQTGQRRGSGSTQPPQVQTPMHVSPLPRHLAPPYAQDADL